MTVLARSAAMAAAAVIAAFAAGFGIGRLTSGDPALPPGALPLDLGTVGPKVQAIAAPAALPDLRPGG